MISLILIGQLFRGSKEWRNLRQEVAENVQT